MNRLAGRLVAPSPGWTRTADVVVVGSGVAGLAAVLHARSAGLSVMVVTKALLDTGSTRWAQGGIAAALGPEDDPEQHLRDTLTAGVGICDEAAVRLLVTEGPGRVRELAALGAAFDRADGSADFALTREGGHSRNRVVHAGGDATGLEVERALIAAVRADPEVEVIEHALVLDLLRAPAVGGAPAPVAGLTLHVLGEGSRDGVGAVLARAVILATGGLGQIFASTTNPPVSTGDGVALALRGGAEVADLEFVQFHPTALWLGGTGEKAHGQQPLVSEAVRGEGAVLIDESGARVMPEDGHPLRDLAPRDIVTKQMSRVMSRTGTDHLFLDARALGADVLLARFPTIVATCRSHGIDPVTDPIPVTPAAHYASGGVKTDANGQVAGPRGPIPGLYACGEVACTGVHGANRLASNSLLEGLVFAARIGQALPATIPVRRDPETSTEAGAWRGVLPAATLRDVTTAMTDGAGVLRSAASLEAAAKSLEELGRRPGEKASTETWEATNAHLVASALVAAATVRRETRGCHWREDFPDADEAFRGHLVTHLTEDGMLATDYRPVAS
ncbi:MAG TPA: L-aspartate oxidase [Frankiaceae bacterium]|nr:L-aspartate oxidase [Frankiaceae bacterium]